jgi:hypothetical protein
MAHWFPIVMLFICLFSWAVVENVRQAFTIQMCVCKHAQRDHQMDIGSRMGAVSGACQRCHCRAFIGA